MKSDRKLENWSQKVSQTLKAWVLSQIKRLISHLNEIIESCDTQMIRLIHFRSHFLIEIHIAFSIQNCFTFSDISTFQNWNTISIHTYRIWTNYSNPGQLYPPRPLNFKVVFFFQGLRRVDKTNQTPQHDTSRTRCLTMTFGEGGVSPIFFLEVWIFCPSTVYFSTLKFICFYAWKIFHFLTIPTQHFLKKNIAIVFVHFSSQFCFGVLTCLFPMLSIPFLIFISQFSFLLW